LPPFSLSPPADNFTSFFAAVSMPLPRAAYAAATLPFVSFSPPLFVDAADD